MKKLQIKIRRFNVVLGTLGLLFAFHNSFAAETFNPAYTGRPTATGPIENGTIDVSSNNEVAYRTMYSRDHWTGDIDARAINKNGSIDESRSLSGWESPAARLGKMDSENRIIFTSNGTSSVPFRWAQLSQQQQGALGGEINGSQVLQYIRGQQPNGANFRPRKSLLGDIVHSNLYVWKHSTAPNSPTLLYVGANDGMLHAFNAQTGHEVFAFIPSRLIDKLKTLTEKEYKHNYFVDGQISIARVVKTQSGTQTPDIRTVLVGTLGRGGDGLYALDVTNPVRSKEEDAAKMLMWEITNNASFPNLGQVHGTAQISRLADDTPVAIFGNGYNSKKKSTLYAVHLFTGQKVLDIQVGNEESSAPSGLATPTLYDLDVNGKADIAYAGDINGNLWKFDLVKKNATKLFTTAGNAPITTPPVITPHPNGGLMVVFGTGQLISENDAESKQKNTVYGIWDGAPDDNTKLLEQTFDTVQTSNSKNYRTISKGIPIWKKDSNGHRGWKVDLPEGERMVSEEPTIYAGRFYLVTTNPTTTFRKNWLNELDMLTGSSQKCPAFDLDGDGVYCTPNGTPDPDDLMPNNKAPVSQELDAGVISQARLIKIQSNQIGTLYNWNDNRIIITDPPKDTPSDPPPTGGGGPGISGGHFDFDSFKNTGGSYVNTKHVHEYDDKYGVTGVNMLEPSEGQFRLSTIVGSPTRPFKILLLNQYLNPAVAVSIGGYDYESVKTYGGLAGNISSNELKNGKPEVSTAESVLNNQPVYDLNNITTLIFNLPFSAFQTNNWWGQGGDNRAGLMPTQTGCVNGVSSKGVSQTKGERGERYNGAFTIQIIDANTPASALELNTPDDVRNGWRVKESLISQWVIGEYAAFWHHSNGACYGEKEWKKNAPQETIFSGGGSNTTGSGDPTRGLDSPIKNKKPPKDKNDDGQNNNNPPTNNPGGGTNQTGCTANCGKNGFISPPKVPTESFVNAGKVVNRESWLEIFR
jgi:hypothetical protein